MPATKAMECSLDKQGIIDWMTFVVPKIPALGYVDKIFWNNINYVSLIFVDFRACTMLNGCWLQFSPTIRISCNAWLTKDDGSPTGLLGVYKSLC